jgi:ATP-dependent Clp protease ATP-binding subunit ClpC
MQLSSDLQRIYQDADEMAARSGRELSTADLLLALLSQDSRATALLRERRLGVEQFTPHLPAVLSDEEGVEVVAEVQARARQMALGVGATEVNALHLLMVLSRVSHCAAYRLLARAGCDPAQLRNLALAHATGRMGVREAGPAAGPPHPSAPPAPGAAPRMPRVPSTDGPAAQTAPPPGLPSAGRAPSPPPERPAERRSPAPVPGPTPHAPHAERGPAHAERAPSGGGAPARSEPAVPPEPFDLRPEPPPPRSPFSLDPDEYPWLCMLGRNLSELAFAGRIDQLIGRQKELEQLVDILGKRRANNPCLIGEAGVGKTAIVEGLALKLVKTPEAIPQLHGKVIVEINMGPILSGTQMRGSFEERMAGIREEVKKAAESPMPVIIFIDEIHTLVGAGRILENPYDASNELKAALARGEFPCIGATTIDEYKKSIEGDPALERRFTSILVAEPSQEETRQILDGIAPVYAEHHKIRYAGEALDAAVKLSSRYLSERHLPDKAIALLDLAGSRARRRGKGVVEPDGIAEIVAESISVPVERLLMTDRERFLRMEEFLSGGIVGHKEIIKKVSQVIRRNYAGFNSRRPIGSFLFLGPTGVGKTEMAKVLADFLFGQKDALVRFDMSEFMEPHSVARLIGSPPGYVGHQEGGQLTEQLRRKPYQIVLLDEVEKAHRDILQILLQILDDGRLTDGRGRTVDFTHAVVIMTSNLGSEHYKRRRGRIGFGSHAAIDDHKADDIEQLKRDVLGSARQAFPIELWNRIEEPLVFSPLGRDEVAAVARLLIRESSKRLADERGITFSCDEGAIDYLIEHGGFDPELGARPMRGTITRLVESPIAEQILAGALSAGDDVLVRVVTQESGEAGDGNGPKRKLAIERRIR